VQDIRAAGFVAQFVIGRTRIDDQHLAGFFIRSCGEQGRRFEIGHHEPDAFSFKHPDRVSGIAILRDDPLHQHEALLREPAGCRGVGDPETGTR
jgi:hypothetical protein